MFIDTLFLSSIQIMLVIAYLLVRLVNFMWRLARGIGNTTNRSTERINFRSLEEQ